MRRAKLILLAALFASASYADETNDLAAIAAMVPGTISRSLDGWRINNRYGTTWVIRESNGYTVTTPTESFYLNRTTDGFSVSAGRPGVRRLSQDERIDVLQRYPKSKWRKSRR